LKYQFHQYQLIKHIRVEDLKLKYVKIGRKSLVVGRHSPICGKIALICEFYVKNDKMADIDNYNKILLDSLKDNGVIEDDRFIYELHSYKYHSDKEFIRITITKV